MTDTNGFRKVEKWRSALGLLYVPLRDSIEDRQRYILLNGLTGNFCLDFEPSDDSLAHRATAWSSDVGHYVSINNEVVTIHRWDKRAPTENYSWRSVIERIHEFHRYLENDVPDRSKSIIAHALRVFRRIRAALGEDQNAFHSLDIFLYMLACAASASDRSGLNADQWGLPPEATSLSSLLPGATWDSIYLDLVGAGRYEILRPDFELVLRHASGTLFQEAHIEARVSPNYWLPGLEGPVSLAMDARPNETGVFFTPPALARTLAEEAILAIRGSLRSDITIFDPACGSGELLRECLRLLKLRNYKGQVKIIGFDKSLASVSMAKFALACEKRYWPPNQVEVDIRQKNSLLVSWPSGVDIVIMNPPFQSWQQMDSNTQEEVTEVLGKQLKNKPNLAMAFAIRAVETIADNVGVLAMIAPTSLLEGASGKQVREALARQLNPVLIAKLGDQRVFAHALVDAGMYIGTTSRLSNPGSAILWADPQPISLSRALRGLRRWRGAETEPLQGEGFSIYLRKDIGDSGAPWKARSFDAWLYFETARRSKRTISAQKLFEIKQGVRLGNDVFIVAKDYVNSLPQQERRFFRPAVMNVSIKEAQLQDNYYIFYPYSDGLPEINQEQDLEMYVQNYYTHQLLPVKNKLESRKSLGKELNWWELIRPRSWQQGKLPKIISKYFGGKRSFAFDREGNYVVVVGNAWVLNHGNSKSGLTSDEFYLAALAYLNSSVVESLLAYISVQVSGGQFDLSNKYLKELPILNFEKLDVNYFNQLVQMGKSITDGTIERWSDVDQLILSAFEV